MQDLSAYNSFGLHVRAEDLVMIHSIEDLQKAPAGQVLILGKGSDVLFTDDYHGTILVNDIHGFQVEEKDGYYLIKAGGGLLLDGVIEDLVARNISGLENLSAIPGTVGAAPIQNVGAYGMEIGQVVENVTFYDLDRRCLETFDREQCEFGYRNSYFKRHRERRLFITEITLRLTKEFKPKLSYRGLEGHVFETPYQLREQVIALRRKKLPDPKTVGNAGSFFKNPQVSAEKAEELKRIYPDIPFYPQSDGTVKLAAGWLIDKAGCRNITHGRAGTWENQALVIVNRGGACPHEIVALAKYIVCEVMNRFSIVLEPEVRIYGAYGEVSWGSL